MMCGWKVAVAEADRPSERWTRSLRDADGKQPLGIAIERGHTHPVDPLQPGALSDEQQITYRAWDDHLQRLVQSRTQDIVPPPQMRYVSTEGALLLIPCTSFYTRIISSPCRKLSHPSSAAAQRSQAAAISSSSAGVARP